jgi:hypothetical protein
MCLRARPNEVIKLQLHKKEVMCWSTDRLLILKDCAPRSELQPKTLKHGFDNIRGKGKFISVHVKKLYKANRGIAPPILNISVIWKWVW